MLEIVSQGFKSAKNALTGKTTLTEANIDEALREIRVSLLEADVEVNVARAFLDEGLVDRLALFQGPATIGADGVESPQRFDEIPADFRKLREAAYGDDQYVEYVRNA